MTVTYSVIGRDCYNQDGSSRYIGINLWDMGPFAFSNTRYKFTAVGCNTRAYIRSGGKDFTTGCISYCTNEDNVINGSCTGIGCCQSSIPPGVKYLDVSLTSFNHHKEVRNFDPCSYSFLIEEDQFDFFVSDLHKDDFQDGVVPVVLDWTAGDETCEKAKANTTAYACPVRIVNAIILEMVLAIDAIVLLVTMGILTSKEDAMILMSVRVTILAKEMEFAPTREEITGYLPKGYPWQSLLRRRWLQKEFERISSTQGLLSSIWTYWIWRKREISKLKEKFFQQNGSLLLQQKITSRREESFRIFTAKELERATENYSDSKVLGQGGYGIVYKGILPDDRIVAIKKSKIMDTTQIDQFINELDILSQVNHRNVVKILGCCLEDQVPLLVYEFVSNGTLYGHIHETSHTQSISFQNRLRTATETADAFACLHSAASIPIFHRDVKSSNILLDDNLTAKVSDFGASRLVPIDQTQMTTLVQGTLGYLDPEVFQTSQLIDKSDVYSFGVVLVELLTAQKPICLNRLEKERTIAMHFISAMKENHRFQVLDDQVKAEGQEAQLMAIAQLAKRCLKLKRDERPTLKEVVVELQGLRGFQDHPWVNNNVEETESLLGGTSQGCTGEASGQYSLENRFISNFEDGR